MLGKRLNSSVDPYELSVFKGQRDFHARSIVDAGSQYLHHQIVLALVCVVKRLIVVIGSLELSCNVFIHLKFIACLVKLCNETVIQ